jgi:hypothetical protein
MIGHFALALGGSPISSRFSATCACDVDRIRSRMFMR